MPELVGDRIAVCADRVHGLRPACADAADNLVRVSGDSGAHRGGRAGKLSRDRLAVRVDGFGGLERRAATVSPWTLSVSAASSVLAETRLTTVSA